MKGTILHELFFPFKNLSTSDTRGSCSPGIHPVATGTIGHAPTRPVRMRLSFERLHTISMAPAVFGRKTIDDVTVQTQA